MLLLFISNLRDFWSIYPVIWCEVWSRKITGSAVGRPREFGIIGTSDRAPRILEFRAISKYLSVSDLVPDDCVFLKFTTGKIVFHSSSNLMWGPLWCSSTKSHTSLKFPPLFHNLLGKVTLIHVRDCNYMHVPKSSFDFYFFINC